MRAPNELFTVVEGSRTVSQVLPIVPAAGPTVADTLVENGTARRDV